MVEMPDEAEEVADAVAVGVGEGPRVDLVEHRGLPPRLVRPIGGVGSRPPGFGSVDSSGHPAAGSGFQGWTGVQQTPSVGRPPTGSRHWALGGAFTCNRTT